MLQKYNISMKGNRNQFSQGMDWLISDFETTGPSVLIFIYIVTSHL